ncbi:hypothetical protein RclHR1_01880013 [Rhizophagus clarus]|uniref:Uncharacterized protein n=1 Tax=Rhizophagus clarus TaxID=94130 RepID=A0A2Z6QS83_9GLOM|nr:hypothetical protein RclHR1_01880013 [Rhizophagus clarus]GES90257.1 hypothetical protein GLOIN_2v1771827 [Rhizophagus clarus]
MKPESVSAASNSNKRKAVTESFARDEYYIGYDELISYLKERKYLSYRGFLLSYRKVIVNSLFTDDWNNLDNTWAGRFLEEAEKLPLNRKDLMKLIKKVKLERDGNGLQMYWTGVINECGKENILTTISIQDSNPSIELWTKQMEVLEKNKDKLLYRHVVNNALLVASAYENLVEGNIIPFIKSLKTFLLARSQMSLYSADEPVLQAIVESLLPLIYRIPELSLVMDGKKEKGCGRFGYSDIFILKDIGDSNSNVSLELKYISLSGLMKNQKNKFGANDLENLDKVLEKEKEEILLKRLHTYWSKEHKETRQITIGEVLNNGVNQLKSYMNIISKGKTADYYSSGVFDKRVKITKSDPNKLKGFVVLVIGFRRVLWRSAEEVTSNYTYNKV